MLLLTALRGIALLLRSAVGLNNSSLKVRVLFEQYFYPRSLCTLHSLAVVFAHPHRRNVEYPEGPFLHESRARTSAR